MLKPYLYICAIVLGLVFARCAQVAPLNGGEQDKTPPKLILATPALASTNFTATTIELKFDEFVQVVDIPNQVIITPQTKELPEIEARGKKVIITFNEVLLPNTTYRLFFGNAIADMHERNPLANFEYVFSTGSTIDSFKVAGNVENAFTTRKEKDILIGLYEVGSSDSVIFNKKPMYFTKTDPDGNYKINYLPKAKFKSFAFSDKNKNMLYDGGEEIVGFLDSIVDIPNDSILNFKVFKEEQNKRFIKKSYSFVYGSAYVVFNKELYNAVRPLNKTHNDLIRSEPSINDTCAIYYYNVYDTLKVVIDHLKLGSDTLRIPILSKGQFEKQKADKKLRLDIDMEGIETGKFAFFNNPSIRFGSWIDISKNDTTKMKWSSAGDSIGVKPLLTMEGANKMIISNTLKPGTEYRLLLNKGAFTDKSGIESDSMQFKFKTNTREDYANLNLKLVLPQKESYIVQIVNNQGRVIDEQYLESSIAASSEKLLKFMNVIPGEYFIKVIEDKNKNKIWDTGNLMLKKHAETIYFNAQTIKLLPDWESDIEWKISEN